MAQVQKNTTDWQTDSFPNPLPDGTGDMEYLKEVELLFPIEEGVDEETVELELPNLQEGTTSPKGLENVGGNQQTISFCFLRFFHANPSVGAVDIYINGIKAVSGITYRKFTEYKKARQGYYRISVYAAGDIRKPIFTARLNLIGGRIYTAALIGTATSPGLELITDNQRVLGSNFAFVRFIQLSQNAPLLDVYIDQRLRIEDLAYQEISRYLSLLPGSHQLKFLNSETQANILEDPDMTLRRARAYSVYIIGDLDDRVGLQVVIALEGVSYLIFS